MRDGTRRVQQAAPAGQAHERLRRPPYVPHQRRGVLVACGQQVAAGVPGGGEGVVAVAGQRGDRGAWGTGIGVVGRGRGPVGLSEQRIRCRDTAGEVVHPTARKATVRHSDRRAGS